MALIVFQLIAYAKSNSIINIYKSVNAAYVEQTVGIEQPSHAGERKTMTSISEWSSYTARPFITKIDLQR